MKMNFTSPIWLQSASNVGGESAYQLLTLNFVSPNQSALITCSGNIIVTSVKNGDNITTEYSNLTNQNISFENDANTSVSIKGNVLILTGGTGPFRLQDVDSITLSNAVHLTDINCFNSKIASIDTGSAPNLKRINFGSCTNLQQVDFSQNKKLEDLTLSSCVSITSLDIFSNDKLNSLSLYGITNLIRIKVNAINETIATEVAHYISESPVSSGTIVLANIAEYNSVIIDAATEKGWEVQYAE